MGSAVNELLLHSIVADQGRCDADVMAFASSTSSNQAWTCLEFWDRFSDEVATMIQDRASAS